MEGAAARSLSSGLVTATFLLSALMPTGLVSAMHMAAQLWRNKFDIQAALFLLPGGWLRNTLGRPEVRAKFVGILNGIDNVEWDPAADPLLPANYSAAQPGGKALCKRFLQRGLGLEEDDKKPIVAVVSRLVPQKGIHLIRAAIYRTLSQASAADLKLALYLAMLSACKM